MKSKCDMCVKSENCSADSVTCDFSCLECIGDVRLACSDECPLYEYEE